MNDAVHATAHAKYTQVKAAGSDTGRIPGIRDTTRRVRRRTTRAPNQKVGERIYDQVAAAQAAKVERVPDILPFEARTEVVCSFRPGKLVRVLDLVRGGKCRLQTTADREGAGEGHDRRLRIGTECGALATTGIN